MSSIKLASFNESKVAPTRWSTAFTRPKIATIQLQIKQQIHEQTLLIMTLIWICGGIYSTNLLMANLDFKL